MNTTLTISPENLEIANCYLSCGSVAKTAEVLNTSPELVSQSLSTPSTKLYINSVFLDTGFNNRFKMRELLDTLITKKLQDLSESDSGSNKDILDILAMSHKFTMEVLDREIALEKAKNSNSNNVNVQINNNSNYDRLITRILDNNAKDQ